MGSHKSSSRSAFLYSFSFVCSKFRVFSRRRTREHRHDLLIHLICVRTCKYDPVRSRRLRLQGMMHSISAFVAACCMIAVEPAVPGVMLHADACGNSTTCGVLGLRQLHPNVTEKTEDDRRLLRTAAASPRHHFGVAASGDFATSRATSDEGDTQAAGLGQKGEHHRRRQQQQKQYRVLLENVDNVQYFGDAMIGNPPQRMKVGFCTIYTWNFQHSVAQ